MDKAHVETVRHFQKEIPALWRFARGMCGKSDGADDLVQETLERALRRIDTFEPNTNLRAWLFTILRHSHINNIRRARQISQPAEIIETLSPPVQASQGDRLIVQDLMRGINLLPQEMQDVIHLIGVEGLSYDEAADQLNVKVGTIKSRLSRARVFLREFIETGRLH